MPGISITIDAGNLNAFLADMQARIQDVTPAMRAFGDYMHTVTENERFEREMSPEGKKWAPLNPDYAADKRKLVGEQPILTLHDRLSNTIHYDWSRTGITIYPNVIAEKYAAVHQFGATIRPRQARALRFQLGGRWQTRQQVTIPARPYLGFNSRDIDQVQETLLDHILPNRA